jgi:hypothetical protein
MCVWYEACFECEAGDMFMCTITVCKACTQTRCTGGGDSLTTNLTSSQLPIDRACPAPTLASSRASLLRPASQTARTGARVEMMFVDQDRAPAAFLKVTFSTDEHLFNGGSLRNLGSKAITAYRLGAVVTRLDGSERLLTADTLVAPADPIEPGTDARIEPQNAFDAVLRELDKTSAVRVMILEVRLSDGSSWHADVSTGAGLVAQ